MWAIGLSILGGGMSFVPPVVGHSDVDVIVMAGCRVGADFLAVLPETSTWAGVDQLQTVGSQRSEGSVDVSKLRRVPSRCGTSEVHREALRMETSGVRAIGGSHPVGHTAVLHVGNQAIYYRKGHQKLFTKSGDSIQRQDLTPPGCPACSIPSIRHVKANSTPPKGVSTTSIPSVSSRASICG